MADLGGFPGKKLADLYENSLGTFKALFGDLLLAIPKESEGTETSSFRLMGPKASHEEQKKLKITKIKIDLPFALYGLSGGLSIDDEVTFYFSVNPRPSQVSAHLLQFHSFNWERHRNISVIPDSYYFSHFTTVVIVVRSVVDFGRLVDAEADYLGFFEKEIASRLNPIIALHNLASKSFNLRNVSPYDIYRIDAWHEMDPSDSYGYNLVTSVFPFCQVAFRSMDSGPDKSVINLIESFAKLDIIYKKAFMIYAQAKHFFKTGNHLVAASQAMTSLEVSVSHYIRYAIENYPSDADGSKRIRWSDYSDVKRDVPFAFLLNSLLPLLLPAGAIFPRDVVNKCNSLRKKRNNAIHNPEQFRGIEESELDAAENLLHFLVNCHKSP